jgi:hypothetical protein
MVESWFILVGAIYYHILQHVIKVVGPDTIENL